MEPANSHDGQLDQRQAAKGGARRAIALVAAGALAAVLALTFVAYQRPELLLELANVRYCN